MASGGKPDKDRPPPRPGPIKDPFPSEKIRYARERFERQIIWHWDDSGDIGVGWASHGGVLTRTAVQAVQALRKQNGLTLGRVLGQGSVGLAEEGPDGRMYATILIPPDELVFEPGVLVLPHGGDLELTIINDDNNTHCALLPSNGDSKFIWLVNFSFGTATLNLDGPGYYWYGSRTGNDEGMGLTGAIVVGGQVPPEARLDRPPQPRP